MILKPMTVGEILDNSFSMFREQLKSYLAIAALGAAPAIVFSLMLLFLAFFMGKTAAIIVAVVIFIPCVAIYLAMTGGLVKKAAEQISGKDIGIEEAYRFGFRKAWHLFLGSILYGLALLIGSILLIIPGIYFSICFALFFQAIIIEDKGPWSAMARSKELVKGSWWRSFGIIVLILVLVSVISSIVTIPVSLLVLFLFGRDLVGTAIETVLTTPVSFLLTPFSMIAYTLLYYDLRIRKENLDLKLMVDNLAESGDKPPGD